MVQAGLRVARFGNWTSARLNLLGATQIVRVPRSREHGEPIARATWMEPSNKFASAEDRTKTEPYRFGSYSDGTRSFQEVHVHGYSVLRTLGINFGDCRETN
jgi:hypothetical protein